MSDPKTLEEIAYYERGRAEEYERTVQERARWDQLFRMAEAQVEDLTRERDALRAESLMMQKTMRLKVLECSDLTLERDEARNHKAILYTTVTGLTKRAEKAEAALTAGRERSERLEKALQAHLQAIGHDETDEKACDVGPGCTLCGLSKALRPAAPQEPK